MMMSIFRIEDPFGNLVHQGGLVSNTHSFEFRPINTGIYKLVYDNSISIITSKTIRAEWVVNWR